MLSDFVRVTSLSSSSGGGEGHNSLYSEADIDRCISRMEAVDFRQKMGVDSVGFMFFNAGHVLGVSTRELASLSVSCRCYLIENAVILPPPLPTFTSLLLLLLRIGCHGVDGDCGRARAVHRRLLLRGGQAPHGRG